MKSIGILFFCFLFDYLTSLNALADHRMPQDGWVYEGKRVLNTGFRCVTVGPDGLVYAGLNGKIAVFDRDLNPLSDFGSFSTIYGLECDSQTNIYVLEQSSLRVFDHFGIQLRQWDSAGDQDAQFGILTSTPNGPVVRALAIDSQDLVYVADGANRFIKVYNRDGQILKKWGFLGNELIGLDGTFDKLTTVAILPGDLIATWSYGGPDPRRYQVFDADGNYLWRVGGELPTRVYGVDMHDMTPTPDGLLMISQNKTLVLKDSFDKVLAQFEYANDGLASSSLGISFPCGRANRTVYGIAFDSDGRMYVAVQFSGCVGEDGLYAFERAYGEVDRPLNAHNLPQPRIEYVRQRSGTTLIDIDYSVLDSDSETVQVAILGFQNGANDLGNLVKMSAFVEGTSANLGVGVAANQTHRITWDVAVDWNVGFGNIEFEILAKDQRGLLPFRFVTVPENGQSPSVQVSDSPVESSRLLSIWYWLIATDYPGVTLIGGEVFGSGGDFDGKKLASGGGTTADGMEFMHELLGVRALTQEEVDHANGGKYGFTSPVGSQHVAKVQ